MKLLKKWQSSSNYTWIIVFICCLMVFTVLGFCSSSRSIYVSPICEALGISRSAFSINESFRYVTTAIVNIFFGTLIAKFGAKKMILAGFASLIASMLIYSQSTNVFGFCLGGIFLGVGLSWTTTTMIGSVISKWCANNRGTIMGIVLASNGIGAAIAIQILTPIIYADGNAFGYRISYRFIAVILFIVGLIMMVFFKNEPDKNMCSAEEKSEIKQNDEAGDDKSHLVMLKKTYFYSAALCIFFTGMILQGVCGIAAPMLGDLGINSSYVATVLSVHSLVLTLSKFSTGFMCDRIGVKRALITCYFSAFLAMVFLLNSSSAPIGKIAAMAYGIFASFALPLETIMLPIYAGEFSEEKSFNKILGIFVSVNTAGYAIGSPVANLCYDIMDGYDVYIYISCVIIVFAAFVMEIAINKAQKDFLK